MSRIFLSHSSADEREALALRQWLADRGWNDVFLDIDPQRGLVPGERWQGALRRAADRCEVVVVIVSPAWAGSKWCLAEFLLAKSLNKRILAVALKPVSIEDLPTELTAEWQLASLTGAGRHESVRFRHRGREDRIDWLAEGLQRLREGLSRAGLDAHHFPWPPPDDPQRAPYRGLEPLEAMDAAVYFGRDVETLRGLDALRGMRTGNDRQLFVILGASGAGKSSFLRAGLLPRLARDDRHFLALAPVRPEREPLDGERGLARALQRAQADLQIQPPLQLGPLKARLREGPAALAAFLHELQDAALARLCALPAGAEPPTLVLPVDQAEELFNADAGEQARFFLQLIGGVLRNADRGEATAKLIVAFTIRSDRYEPLQAAPELAGLQSVVFDDLKPMPPTRFRDVITGPARRASEAGRKLVVQPALVDQLVDECNQGGDTLPLLGLTLARLHRDYGSDGEIDVDDYRALGGLASVVRSEVESVLAADAAQRARQLELLRSAFVPWLATINPLNDQPMRRVARLGDLPAAAHPLVHALAERRLLLSDRRDGETVVEVAHEALLRQWDALKSWLDAEREHLKEADALERASEAWRKSGRKEAWLIEGERLALTEALASEPGFARRLDGCRDFLRASRLREDARRDEEQRRQRAELEAAQQLAATESRRAEAAQTLVQTERRARQRQRWFTGGLAVLTAAAVLSTFFAERQRRRADEQQRVALARQLEAQSRASMDASAEGLVRSVLLAIESLRVAWTREGQERLEEGLALLPQPPEVTWKADDRPLIAMAFSADGRWLATQGLSGSPVVWDVASVAAGRAPKEVKRLVTPRAGEYSRSDLAFSRDGRWFAAGCGHEACVFDTATWTLAKRLPHGEMVWSIAFSGTGLMATTSYHSSVVKVYDIDADWAELTPDMPGEGSAQLWATAFSPHGLSVLAAGGKDLAHDQASPVWRDGKARPRLHQTNVLAASRLAFTADGMRLLAAPQDGGFALLDAEGTEGSADYRFTERLRMAGKRPAMTLASAAASADKRHLATTNGVWDITERNPVERARFPESTMTIAFSPTGAWLAIGNQHGEVSLSRRFDGGVDAARLAHGEVVRDVAFDADGRWIATASADRSLRVFETQRWQEVLRKEHEGEGRRVMFSADKRWLAAVSDESVIVLEAAPPWAQRLLLAEAGRPLSAGFSTDQRWFTVVSRPPERARLREDTQLRLYELPAWNAAMAPLTVPGSVEAVATSPDWRYVAVRTQRKCTRGLPDVPGSTRVMERANGREVGWVLRPLEGEPKPPCKGNDKVDVASAGDVALAAQAAQWTWMQLDAGVEADEAASPDGRWLAKRRGHWNDHSVRIVARQAPDLMQLACARLPRAELDEEAWKRYMGHEVRRRPTCPEDEPRLTGVPAPAHAASR